MSRTNKIFIFSTLALVIIITISGLLSFWLEFQEYLPLFGLVCLSAWSLFNVWAVSDLVERKGKFLIAATLLIALSLTFLTSWFSFVGFLLVYYGLVIFILTVVVFLIQRLFKRYKSSKWILFSSTLILSGTLAVLVGGIVAAPTPLFEDENGTGILKHLYETDQEDRFSGYWILNPSRDQQRLEFVLEAVEDDTPMTPDEKYFAAFILQHGTCEDHFRIANELASEAAENNVEGADWLAEATFDRWQLALGNQQVHGTQQMPIPIERPCN